jgi:hypothetical protein
MSQLPIINGVQGEQNYRLGRDPGLAVVFELVPGLFLQTFGIGNIYAGNVMMGVLMMVGYWVLSVVNFFGTIENLVGKGKRGAEPDSNTPNERQEWVRTALCDGKPPDSLDPWPSGPPNLEGARRGFRGLGTRHQAIPQPILGADCPPATH